MPHLNYFSTTARRFSPKRDRGTCPKRGDSVSEDPEGSTMEVMEGGQSGGGHKGPSTGPVDILVYTGITSAPGGSFQKTVIKQHFPFGTLLRTQPRK